VETPFSPVKVFETPLITKDGKDYRITDRFTLKTQKKAIFPKGDAKTKDGKQSLINMNPRGDFKL